MMVAQSLLANQNHRLIAITLKQMFIQIIKNHLFLESTIFSQVDQKNPIV